VNFKEWVQEKYKGDTQGLLQDLGLKGSHASSITVRSLSERITRLGYTGDALHTCMTLSRCNNSVQVHDLADMLGKGAAGPRQSLSYAGRKWGFRPTERRKAIGDSGEKPAWNASIYDPVPLNSRLGVRERHYFCKPFDRPIRDDMMKELETKGFKFKQESEKGAQLTRQQLRKKRGHDDGGIRPATKEDLQRVNDAVAQSDPAAQQPAAESAQAATQLATTSKTTAKPKAAGASKGPWKIRVFLYGGIGLSDETTDEDTMDPYCTVEIAGKPDSQFRKSIQRETKKGKEDKENADELVGCGLDDELEFAVYEEDAEEDDEDGDTCNGVATLSADRFLPNGFEGRLDLLDDEENPIDGTSLMIKVVVLGPG